MLKFPEIMKDLPKLEMKDKDGNTIYVAQDDADTYVAEGGKHMRTKGVYAAETIHLKHGAVSPGSVLGNVQDKATRELLPEYGYTNTERVGSDYYGRDLTQITNAGGSKWDDFLISNGIVLPNQSTTNRQMDLLSLQTFQNRMNPDRVPTPVDKARALVDNVLGEGVSVIRPQLSRVEDYQDYVASTSFKGLAEQEEAIKALEQRLLSPKIDDKQRVDAQGLLTIMRDRYQQNLINPQGLFLGSVEGASFRGKGSFSSELGRSGDKSLVHIKDAAANFLQYLGDAVDSKRMQSSGRDMRRRNARERRLIDVSAGDRDITGGTTTDIDSAQWSDPMSVLKFISNSIVEQGPQMAVMMGMSTVGAAAGTVLGPGGVIAGSLLGPMMFGVAGVYGEMPEGEKSVLVATAVGAAIGLVDRHGFAKGAIRGTDLLTKAGLDDVAGKIARKKGVSLDEAKDILNKDIRSLGKEYAIAVTSFAGAQLAAKKGFTDVIGSVAKVSGKEAATELVQEVMQYLAITGTTSTDFDWVTLYKRSKEAAVIGGLLGGAIGSTSAMHDRSVFNEELNKVSGVETRDRTKISLMEEQERARNNGVKLDDIGIAAQLRNDAFVQGDPRSLDQMSEGHIKQGALKDLASLVPDGGLLQQSRTNLMEPYIGFAGGRMLAGLLDTLSVRGVYSGMSPFKRLHMITNSVLSGLPTNKDKRDMLGSDDNLTTGAILMASADGQTQHPGAKLYRQRLDEIGAALQMALWGIQSTSDWNVNDLASPDFLLRHQPLDPYLVGKNVDQFVADMIAARDTSQDLMPVVPDPVYYKDLAKRVVDELTHRELLELKNLGVLTNPLFTKYKSKDVEGNILKTVGMISRSAVRSAMFGSQGEVLAAGVRMMLNAGEITPEQAGQLSIGLKQQLDAFDGRLNKSTSPTRRWVEENLTFVSLLVYMDTSLFANLAEVVFGALGLSHKDMFRYFGKVAKNFAYDVVAKGSQAANYLTRGVVHSVEESELSPDLKRLSQTGQYGRTSDIPHNVGASVTSQAYVNMAKLMFKINLVESVTNAARAARGAIASDQINELVAALAELPVDNPSYNDTTRWYRDRLASYRVDPDELVKLYREIGSLSLETVEALPDDSKLAVRAKELLLPGIVNFIDEFSARPEPGSTAKVFDDQRFRLFTQFQKFTWHFTSNIIPQLWNMYIKRGPTKYTYSAFSTIALAFAVAYMGMYMKEALRGDKTDEDDEEKINKRLRQAFDYSVGQAPSSIFTAIDRATAERPDGSLKTNPLKSLFVNQSPGLSLAWNSSKDAYGIATKDDDTAEKSRLLGRLPIFGEIPGIRHYFEKD